ncbi:MAG: M81 family metallopeptidase [Hyphomicrobiaceae bacterium]
MTRRVLIAGFKHETNTFSVLPTTMDDYRGRVLYFGDEIGKVFADTNSEICGFMDVAEQNGWRPVYSVVADASPSGPVSRATFEEITSRIIADASSGGGVDAILLQLHGAMVAEHSPDGEGLLLRLLREKVGPAVPIGVTLDLHGNVTDDMARYADVIVSYRTYPHVDQREIARECAGLIARTLAGEIKPVVVVRRGPMLVGVDHGRTTAPGPMREALAKAAELMKDAQVHTVSVLAGFSTADIPDAGPSVVVVGEGHDPRYRQMADRLVEFIWQTRAQKTVAPVSSEAAVAVARAKGKPGKPVVIADAADNPGGGGYGDSTRLLQALVDSGLEGVAFGALFDPESAAACHKAGVGGEVKLALGGKVDPAFGPPVGVVATVTALSDGKFLFEGPMQRGVPVDMGPSAAIKSGGVEVVIASRRYQNYDRMFFLSLGIDPNARAVVGVKSAQHFRAAYQPMASEVVVVDEGNGITTRDFSARTYTRIRRPIFPLDLE